MPAENQVTVGGTPALVTATSEVQITFLIPDGVRSGVIVITSPAGTATSAQAFTVVPIITTVAGDGTPAFGGDGGPATSAQLNQPVEVALDGAGNLFIAEFSNHRIRRVEATTGIITTVAGDGTPAFGGDGGPATSAQLNFPVGLALDGAGNLFIADTGNNRIRKVAAATGRITTVAGEGTPGFGGDTGPATSAQLNFPIGLALDRGGTLFIGDCNNHRIRRVDPLGVITTVAGTGTPGFSGDGGPATGAQLNCPQLLSLDGAGNLFITDTFNHAIRKLALGTGIIRTVAGTGVAGYNGDGIAATSAQLNLPGDVALDASGNLFIADFDNNRIRRVDAGTGIITTVAGDGTPAFGGDGGPATSAQLFEPNGLAFDANGNLFIADFSNNRIRKVNAP